jgi:hypothetical protein
MYFQCACTGTVICICILYSRWMFDCHVDGIFFWFLVCAFGGMIVQVCHPLAAFFGAQAICIRTLEQASLRRPFSIWESGWAAGSSWHWPWNRLAQRFCGLIHRWIWWIHTPTSPDQFMPLSMACLAASYRFIGHAAWSLPSLPGRQVPPWTSFWRCSLAWWAAPRATRSCPWALCDKSWRCATAWCGAAIRRDALQ